MRGEEGMCEGIRMRKKSKGNMRGREEHLRRRGNCLKGEEVLHDCLKKYCYAYLLWLLFTSCRLTIVVVCCLLLLSVYCCCLLFTAVAVYCCCHCL